MELNGKTGVLQKVVFELRYRHGYVYLDKCGRTIEALTTQYPEWILKDESVSPQGAPLFSLHNQCLLNFSAKRLDLNLEMPSGGDSLNGDQTSNFAEQVESTSTLIIEELGLKDFERMGFRAWYLFPCASPKESWDWTMSLGFFQIGGNMGAAFTEQIASAGLTVVFRGQTSYRVALNQVQRTAQIDLGQDILKIPASKLSRDQRQAFLDQLKVKKRLLANPDFAAMIDVDAFQEDPKILDAKQFVIDSLKKFPEKLTQSAK